MQRKRDTDDTPFGQTTVATDLKLIDELLCLYVKRTYRTWEDVENHSNIPKECMARLRQAWESGEMEQITFGLSGYFGKDAK